MNLGGAEAWTNGLFFSVLGSMIGAGSKLAIRKSFTILADADQSLPNRDPRGPTKNDGKGMHKNDSSHMDEGSRLQLLGSRHMYDETIPTWAEVKAFSLRGLGVIGMAVLGPMCNVYALQFASPSVLCPISSGLMLVWIVLLSESTINERPHKAQVSATGLIVLGEICIGFAGDHTNVDDMTLEDVRQQYSEETFLAFFRFMIVWVVFLVLLIKVGSKGWQRFAWGVIGGSVTGMQCFIKDALALMHGLGNMAKPPIGLFVMLLLAGLIPLSGLLLLMNCMRRYDALYSASMYVGSLVISSSLMSAAHYHTFDHLKRSSWMIYPAGLLLLLTGTAMLAVEGHFREEKEKSEQPQKQGTCTQHHPDHRNAGGYGSIELQGDPCELTQVP